MECSICLKFPKLKDIRKLPCHKDRIFCLKCLQKKLPNNADSFQCLICDKRFPYSSKIGFNLFALRDVIGTLRSILINDINRAIENLKVTEKKIKKNYNQPLQNLCDSIKKEHDILKLEIEDFLDKKNNNLEYLISKINLNVKESGDEWKKRQLWDIENVSNYLDGENELLITSNLNIFRNTLFTIYNYEIPSEIIEKKIKYIDKSFTHNSTFYLFCSNGFYYTFNKGKIKAHQCMKFIDIAQDKKGRFYFLERIDTNSYNIYLLQESTGNFKKLKVNNRLIFDRSKMIIFIFNNEIIFYNPNSHSLEINQELQDNQIVYDRRMIQPNLILVINDSIKIISFESFLLSSITIPITRHKTEISLRENIIDELKNGKILLCSENFIYVYNSLTQTAVSFPKNNLEFLDGLRNYSINSKELQFLYHKYDGYLKTVSFTL